MTEPDRAAQARSASLRSAACQRGDRESGRAS